LFRGEAARDAEAYPELALTCILVNYALDVYLSAEELFEVLQLLFILALSFRESVHL
jgi:hypothetical protein